MKNFIVEFFCIINENSELFKIAPVYKSQLVLKPHYNFFFYDKQIWQIWWSEMLFLKILAIKITLHTSINIQYLQNLPEILILQTQSETIRHQSESIE